MSLCPPYDRRPCMSVVHVRLTIFLSINRTVRHTKPSVYFSNNNNNPKLVYGKRQHRGSHKVSLNTGIPVCGEWWLIGRVDAYFSKGREFDSRSSRHVGTLGKSFARSCRRCFGVKLRHSIRAMFGAPLDSSGLEEALYK